MGTGAFFAGGLSCRCVKLTTYLLKVLWLRMRGSVRALPQYVSMAWCVIKQGMCLRGVMLSKAQDKITFTFTFIGGFIGEAAVNGICLCDVRIYFYA